MDRPVYSHCPLCGGDTLLYLLAHAGTPIVRCDRCGLVLRNPQPSDAELTATCTGKPVPASHHAQERRVLTIGPECIAGGRLAKEAFEPASLDAAMLNGVLEHTRDPLAELRQIWHALRPGGRLEVVVATLDNRAARSTRDGWAGLRPERLFYFDSATLQLLLFKAGFEQVTIAPGWNTNDHERRHVMATRSASLPPTERAQRLTVVMPVYNECSTFSEIIDRVLRKSIPGVEIDVVIVESNSTDGTREAVKALEGRERVTVVYEDRPQGKGHAVRAGLTRATGDYVLIQDADLEYDVDDYDALLDPLMTGRAAFVLGTRHGKNGPTWKVRHFADQVAVSSFMNLGHVLFTALFNVTYGTRLRDPFTMYKVFRRDCLHGLTFEANRFDFDFELAGKLVRAGYRPLEVPVNYRSRSFSQGKKVTLVRDPLNWVWACLKFRFQPLGKKAR